MTKTVTCDPATEVAARQIEERVRQGVDPAPKTMTRCARQGDVMLVRESDAAGPTEFAVAEIARGNHGAHVALGRVTFDGTTLVVGEGGAVVVHTDEPSARHRAVSVPGNCTVRVTGLREMDRDGIVRQVRD